MKLTDKLFWKLWFVLVLLESVSCMAEGWSEDSVLLGVGYAMSLLSTLLCHRVRPRAVSGNLTVMIVYNVILSYNLAFNSQYGRGLIWFSLILLLNALHSIALTLYSLIAKRSIAD